MDSDGESFAASGANGMGMHLANLATILTNHYRSVWPSIFFVAVLTLRADIHPVPLEKNATSAQCLECHSEKAKGKFVHTAVSAGCTSCHEVRVNKDVTRVKLVTTTPYSLCLTCHADKNAADIKGTVHKPAVRDCTEVPRSAYIRQQVSVAESDCWRSEGKSLSGLSHHGVECARKGKPPHRVGHGLRDLPCNAQDRRARQPGIRLSPDEGAARHCAWIATIPRTRACRKRTAISRSARQTALSAMTLISRNCRSSWRNIRTRHLRTSSAKCATRPRRTERWYSRRRTPNPFA